MFLEWEKVDRSNQLPGSWTVERAGHTATLIGSRVYVVGGSSKQSKFLDPQYCYLNTITYEWTPMYPQHDPNVENVSVYHSATLVDDRILLMGGIHRTGQAHTVDLKVRWFDPIMSTVVAAYNVGQIPASRFKFIAGYLEDLREVLIFGGMNLVREAFGELTTLHVDRMKFVTLETKGSAPLAQYSHCCKVVGRAVYMYCRNEERLFRLEYDGKRAVWSSPPMLGQSPGPLYGTSMNLFNGKLFMYGGVQGRIYTSGLYIYDLKSREWGVYNIQTVQRYSTRKLGPDRFPPAIRRHIGVVVQNKILIIGGIGTRLDVVWELHITGK